MTQSRDDKILRYERIRTSVRPDGKPYTDADCAKELEVTTKTIQRWKKELGNEGRFLKNQIPNSQYMRDEIFERHVDTFEMIRRAILRTERMQERLDAELGFSGEA